jgi:uncharacterized membrane protein
MNNKLIKKLVNYFLQGLLYTAPLGITIWVLYSIFIKIDGLFNGIIPNHKFPGLGILVLIIGITLMGFIGKYFFTLPISHFFKDLINRLPFVKLIYTSISDLLKAFVGKEKKFTEPVLVKINNVSNLEKVGFITQRDLTDLGVEGQKIAVYFPHSYAFSGEMYIVPAEYIKPIDKTSSDIMKFIVSGGVSKT